MKNILKLLLLCASLQAAGQQTKLAYTGTVQAGLLEGETGSAFQLKTVNGLRYKTWSAGVGTGLDFYHTRTIPVYLEVRKNLGSGASTPFVYVDGGYHFVWETTAQKQWGETGAEGGLYFDAGLGYQFPVMKNNRLFFSAGYSAKKLSKKVYYPVYIDFYPAPPPQTMLQEYSLRRLSLQVGLRF